MYSVFCILWWIRYNVVSLPTFILITHNIIAKFKQLTIRTDHETYRVAKWKADKLGLPLATLLRVFLKAFISQRGVGFYVGDQDLAHLVNRWMDKKQFEKMHGGRVAVIGPRLKDIFELSEHK